MRYSTENLGLVLIKLCYLVGYKQVLCVLVHNTTVASALTFTGVDFDEITMVPFALATVEATPVRSRVSCVQIHDVHIEVLPSFAIPYTKFAIIQSCLHLCCAY